MEKTETQRIHKIRATIKELSALQVKAKRARKTTIPKDERAALLKECGIKYPEWAHQDVMDRRAQITAALNYYHELRESPHRHGVRKELTYAYEKYLAAFHEGNG